MKYIRCHFKKDGEWIEPIFNDFKLRCCDCGLVHRINFMVLKSKKGAKIKFQTFRDKRATSQVRRHFKTYIIEK